MLQPRQCIMDDGTAHRSHLTGRCSPPRLHDAAPGARHPRPDLAPKFSDHRRLRQGLNPRRVAIATSSTRISRRWYGNVSLCSSFSFNYVATGNWRFHLTGFKRRNTWYKGADVNNEAIVIQNPIEKTADFRRAVKSPEINASVFIGAQQFWFVIIYLKGIVFVQNSTHHRHIIITNMHII